MKGLFIWDHLNEWGKSYTKETEMAVSLYKMNNFINGLFHYAFNSSDYIVLNDSELWMNWKNKEEHLQSNLR
jgi:hypothetical protein